MSDAKRPPKGFIRVAEAGEDSNRTDHLINVSHIYYIHQHSNECYCDIYFTGCKRYDCPFLTVEHSLSEVEYLLREAQE